MWPKLSSKAGAAWAIVAVASFHLAYEFPALSCLIAVYVFGIVQLARVEPARSAFYLSFVAGLFVFGPQLAFMAGIFGPFAIVLWSVGGLWTAAFVMLARSALVRLGPTYAILLLPLFWLACEYFRSEVYWLRFTWLIPGYAFAGCRWSQTLLCIGMYGVGYLLTLASVVLWQTSRFRAVFVGVALLAALATVAQPAALTSQDIPPASDDDNPHPLVAGIQLEFPSTDAVMAALNEVARQPEPVDLVVLSEYTFAGDVPPIVRAWCRDHRCHLIAGGKDHRDGKTFFNTAFVIDSNGVSAFQQAKSVPIQFFQDGLPAPDQQLWESPWGKIGICICYDLSYRAVTDELVRQGAQALIVPTMDVAAWGEHEHMLHAKVAPTRAAEYGIPIVRVCSSGVSQCVAASGAVRRSLPFPGQGEMFITHVRIAEPGSVPLDRYLAMIAMLATVGYMAWLAVCRLRRSPRQT